MANFYRPPGQMPNAYVEKPSGLGFVYAPIGVEREIGLWGGRDLWVGFNDHLSPRCPARCTDLKGSGDRRLFRVKGSFEGSSMLEARQGVNGSVWDAVTKHEAAARVRALLNEGRQVRNLG